MPSVQHETMIDLFRQRPELAAELLALVPDRLDSPLPEYTHARMDSGDFPDITPTEYRADAVVVLTSEASTPDTAVIIEVQLRHDKDKAWSWPVYLTTLRARLRCPTVLMVLCPDKTSAAKSRTPITIAPRCTLEPIVISPEEVPVITDPATASANPELMVLSAIAHSRHPDRATILDTFATSMLTTPDRAMYLELVTAILPKAARNILETLMNTKYEYKTEFARTYFSEGEAQGEARGEARGEANALLRILRKRGLRIPEDVAARIESETDLDQLNTWLDRAIDADTVDAVFAD
ncbi:hypothetical protein [Nocardia callitridis]|uniref:DUF4351 domain-containing protein n=1 Tax=Nocardia callitridis TaxID=648753 RepID=A0ABP9L550_9NOCA